MKILSLTLSEWVAITSLLTFFFGVLSFLAKRGYSALKTNIVKPLLETLDEVRTALNEVNKSLDTETKWIHDRHSEVLVKLQDHEQQLDEHDIVLTRHEERLKTLCKDRERGYK